MLKIKLTRTGRKKMPSYRIVVAEKRSKLSGRVVDTLGYYNPSISPSALKINQKLLEKWLKNGAQMTLSVKKLLKL